MRLALDELAARPVNGALCAAMHLRLRRFALVASTRLSCWFYACPVLGHLLCMLVYVVQMAREPLARQEGVSLRWHHVLP